ncbi:succinate dehydrogenase/Fumarate reductase transmembrane subunit domain-containing protein [Phthorimaea operculella]|nr:succinate dehydrogenase/Fumarate reductase transmembrane subunit domain-containing protein [Phthorimaea operculella]
MRRQGPLVEKLKQIPVMLAVAGYRTCKPPDASGSKSKLSVKYVPFIKKTYKDHDHKNMTLGRPLSPHLTIQGPTLPAMTSILERITGIQLAAMALIFAGSSLLTNRGIEPVIHFIQCLNLPEWFIVLWKITIAFAFTFHFFNGFRFVMFNLGKWLDYKQAKQTAYLAIVLSIVTAVACGLIGHVYSFM